MNITTQSSAISIGNHVRTFIRKQVTTTLERFDHVIERVDVYLRDINGPKGGADKQVTVVIWMNRGQRVAAQSTDENLYAAVSGSVKKAKRSLRKAVQKALTFEQSGRGKRWISSDAAV